MTRSFLGCAPTNWQVMPRAAPAAAFFTRRKRIRREVDGKKEKKENRFLAVIFVVDRGCSVRYMERSYAK